MNQRGRGQRNSTVRMAANHGVGVLGGSFSAELAMSNGGAVQSAFVADFLRYGLALVALRVIGTGVAEE